MSKNTDMIQYGLCKEEGQKGERGKAWKRQEYTKVVSAVNTEEINDSAKKLEGNCEQIWLSVREGNLIPGICTSPIHPLNDGTSAISAASSRQLLFHVDFRKWVLNDTIVKWLAIQH